MAQKTIKVCDCCKTESILFNTAKWETVIFRALVMGKPEGEMVEYDACGDCVNALKMCAMGEPSHLQKRLAAITKQD